MVLINLLVIVLLIALTEFFVAAEFAIVKVRTSRMEQLIRMQTERNHMAILMDEYSGTSGLMTVENIIEEIIGEVRDEFDADEVTEIRTITANHYFVDAKLSIRDLNELLGIH
jgi:CBS domain containing-hemolysin-like protein